MLLGLRGNAPSAGPVENHAHKGGIRRAVSAAMRKLPLRMVKLEGVDKLLRGIAAYRKRDPADSEEGKGTVERLQLKPAEV